MDISSVSFAVYLAIIPSILLCLYVYNMDVIEKEPLHLLLILFFVGVLTTVPARFVEQMLLSATEYDYANYYDSFYISFFVIALVEEGYKYLVFLISSWRNKEFNYKYDAIVYCVFISLGFATLENILYVQDAGLNVALWRGVISVPAHAFYAISSGFLLGIAKEKAVKKDKKQTALYLLLAFIVPVLMHGAFDFLLLTENEVLFGIFFSFIALLYIISYYIIKKTHDDKKIVKLKR